MGRKLQGGAHARPLEGGFDRWRERGYPIQFRGPAPPSDERILNPA